MSKKKINKKRSKSLILLKNIKRTLNKNKEVYFETE